jgi:hypothetical protein
MDARAGVGVYCVRERETVMSLLGKGALLVWHDIAAGRESDYNEWHSKEHMLERVGVPGFLRGYRHEAISGAPRFLDFYEVEDLATLTSAPYLQRLNHPTPWTEKAVATFRNTNRTLCGVVTSVGNGICGNLLTMQIAAASGRGDGLAAWLRETMPALAQRPGLLGAHYLEGDEAASRTETEEKRLRGTADAIADRVVLVGGYDAAALEEVRRTVLSPAALVAQGAEGTQQAAVYRLLHCITEADLPAATTG